LSGADIARGSGQTRAYISRISTGQANVGLDLLVFLATHHHVSIDWFLTGIGSPIRSIMLTDAAEDQKLRQELLNLREEVEALKRLVGKKACKRKPSIGR